MDRCSFCGKPLISTTSEEWRTMTGELIVLPKSQLPYILADTTSGELYICEECYKKENFKKLTIDELAEIHYQFGLEYRELGCPSESVDALHRGLRLKKTANMLAAIALSYGEMGEQKLECEFYQQALTLDPNHFEAKENLKNIIEAANRIDRANQDEK